MKLKTLKDFGDREFDCVSSLKYELRLEAITWIKAKENNTKANPEQEISNNAIIEWIKIFFNITNEDLDKKEYKIGDWW